MLQPILISKIIINFQSQSTLFFNQGTPSFNLKKSSNCDSRLQSYNSYSHELICIHNLLNSEIFSLKIIKHESWSFPKQYEVHVKISLSQWRSVLNYQSIFSSRYQRYFGMKISHYINTLRLIYHIRVKDYYCNEPKESICDTVNALVQECVIARFGQKRY